MRWFRNLIFLIISLGYFSDLYADKITMNTTCAYCGDRFICGAIDEVVKLKFNFSKKSETARVKDHCETLSVTTSEKIKADGAKTESDLRHETTKAYIEEIVLRSKKKKKSDSLRKRFEQGVKLGELKYFSQPDKKSSQKVYKKLVQARLVIPLKSFDEYKSIYPERASLNYRTYVKDILTQDPYHLSTKGNYEGYYTFALYPDGDVMKANQALVRNTASVGGSLGGGGGGGSSAGASPKAGPNADVMRAPAVPGGDKLVGGAAEAESSPKATLNDQGQWVVENRNSNNAAKPVDMRVLNNSSGVSGVGTGGTDFGAGSDLMNFYKTGNESASRKTGTQGSSGGTTSSNSLSITPEMLTNSVSSNTTKTSDVSSTSARISSTTSSRSSLSSPSLESAPVANVATLAKADLPTPSVPLNTTSGAGVGVPSGPVGTVEEVVSMAVTEKLNRELSRSLSAPETSNFHSKLSSTDATSGGLGGKMKLQTTNAKVKIDTCNKFQDKLLEFSRQEGVCHNDRDYFLKCEPEYHQAVLQKCEEIFGVKFDLKKSFEWVEDEIEKCEADYRKGTISEKKYKQCTQKSSSIDQCMSRLAAIGESYKSKDAEGSLRKGENIFSLWDLEENFEAINNIRAFAFKEKNKDGLEEKIYSEICMDSYSLEFKGYARMILQSKKVRLSSNEKICKKQLKENLADAVKEFYPMKSSVEESLPRYKKYLNLSIVKNSDKDREKAVEEIKKLYGMMKPYLTTENTKGISYIQPRHDEANGNVLLSYDKISRRNDRCSRFPAKSREPGEAKSN